MWYRSMDGPMHVRWLDKFGCVHILYSLVPHGCVEPLLIIMQCILVEHAIITTFTAETSFRTDRNRVCIEIVNRM